MSANGEPDVRTLPTAFLTTKEVASLLRVKERKIYDMAAASEIPHRRITGKLLFPADEITAWIEGTALGGAEPRPDICAGSHDPLLDWAARESSSGLATLFDGSLSGLSRFKAAKAVACGLHLPEAGGWNIETVTQQGVTDCVLIAWAMRVQGLIVAAGAEETISGVETIGNRRVVLRQPGAGARELYERMTVGLDMSEAQILPQTARTETDAALAVASGEADVAFGLKTVADQYRLGFVPMAEEQFDLLIDRRSYFSQPVQCLFAFARTDPFRAKAESLGGYDIGRLGEVRWLSP